MNTPGISLVVIGRNSSPLLSTIYRRTSMATISGYCNDLIYVDSASTDDSAALMQDLGFRVYRLGSRGVLSAAAGRWLGAIQARGDYVLFLDSDMELATPACLPRKVATISRGLHDGLVGRVVDVTPSGSRRPRVRKCSASREAYSFGGFVLLRKKVLLDAGNWNPSMIANEEVELHARLRKLGARIRYDHDFEAFHHTTGRPSLPVQLGSLYFPWRSPGRYGALGRALAASMKAGSALHLIYLVPEPFVLLLCLMALVASQEVAAGILFAAFEAVLLSRRNWRYNAVAPALLLSLPYGLMTYRDRLAEVE